MPLPKPNDDESHDDWMSRCMGNDAMNAEYPDDDQRYAVCQSIWDKDKDESKGVPMSDKVERRVFAAEDAELRVSEDKDPKISGYAARFNKWSEVMGPPGWQFRERLSPGAFDAVLDDDVRCLRNHDPNLLLGRTPNTLSLSVTKLGLKYENTPPNTVTGRETIESIRRGDITGNSFAFIVAEDGEEWTQKDGLESRTITKIAQLFDVGPVTYPAYPDTTVAVRSLQAVKAASDTEPEAAEAPPVEPPVEPVPEPVVEPVSAPQSDPQEDELAAADAQLEAEALAQVQKKIDRSTRS